MRRGINLLPEELTVGEGTSKVTNIQNQNIYSRYRREGGEKDAGKMK
jgi:hypothetical protein